MLPSDLATQDHAIRITAADGEWVETTVGECIEIMPTGCWAWRGMLDKVGTFRHPSEPKSIGAHRYVFEQMVGTFVKASYNVRRTCGRRGCCRPEHLECVYWRDHQRMNGLTTRSRIYGV